MTNIHGNFNKNLYLLNLNNKNNNLTSKKSEVCSLKPLEFTLNNFLAASSGSFLN